MMARFGAAMTSTRAEIANYLQNKDVPDDKLARKELRAELIRNALLLKEKVEIQFRRSFATYWSDETLEKYTVYQIEGFCNLFFIASKFYKWKTCPMWLYAKGMED
eukprot:Pompholyxophrys_punicea_v1_NODE_3_length_10569_cov_612.508655.p11 type:complete len:106 gc:universal NODE_3_length_10569_cov_612.508655:9363-9680(+)